MMSLRMSPFEAAAQEVLVMKPNTTIGQLRRMHEFEVALATRRVELQYTSLPQTMMIEVSEPRPIGGTRARNEGSPLSSQPLPPKLTEPRTPLGKVTQFAGVLVAVVWFTTCMII